MTFGYNQMIDKPTHYIIESSSCIDLIFSSNVNLAKNCELNNHCMKPVTITSFMELRILIYLFPVLILGKLGL